MLWVDKYRPTKLSKFKIHGDIASQLQKLVSEGDCPHLLFYGPSGAGKKTLLMALLREKYGPSVDKLKVEHKPWKIELPGRNIEVELTTISSNHHIELNPSDAGYQDRYVVQMVIKEMAKNRPLDVAGNKSYKMVVLSDVDRLSKEAQHSLRRTMEKYTAACRLILLCNSSSKVIEAVRSRCLCIRVPTPGDAEIVEALQGVADSEGIDLPSELASRLAIHADGNLRRAMLSFEAARMEQYPFRHDQAIQTTDWEAFIAEVASAILSEQSPKNLYVVRGKLYELLVNLIPPAIIIKTLVKELMRKLDDELKHEVVHWAAFYEHRLQSGQKAIFHLEAFVAKFMSIYKRYLINTFG
eukprot:jgi/Mesvir1/20083/Mv13332-RA.1